MLIAIKKNKNIFFGQTDHYQYLNKLILKLSLLPNTQKLIPTNINQMTVPLY